MTTTIAIASLVIANIGTTIGLFMWATNHAAEDHRALRESTERILQSIQQEMKEFHGRLCDIEARRK